MLQTGLVSITFRKLLPAEIVALVVKSGLKGIEWGGDLHVPHGDVKRAAEVGKMTREAGLVVSAYGSYYGEYDGLVFDRVLDSAVALGAPLIRIWAGRKSSAAAAPEDWERIIEDTRRIAAAVVATGRSIAFEFHDGTLNDTPESSARLLRSIGHPAVFTYWQPPVGMGFDDCMQELKSVRAHLRRVHVFHWESDGTRQPLRLGANRWISYLRLLRRAGADVYASIEFVRADSPQAFLEDARTLNGWLAGAAL